MPGHSSIFLTIVSPNFHVVECRGRLIWHKGQVLALQGWLQSPGEEAGLTHRYEIYAAMYMRSCTGYSEALLFLHQAPHQAMSALTYE